MEGGRGASLWFGKVRPKKSHSQLIIAAHLTNYAFIADKVHKNPYIAHYTLLQYCDCFIRVTALLDYLDLGILKNFGGGRGVKSPP